MDSRLIFESARTHLRNVNWSKPIDSLDSEWIVLDSKNNFEPVFTVIENFFITDQLYIALSRNASFESDKNKMVNDLLPLIAKEDFSIWNLTFQKVIEFNKIGVYRKGINNNLKPAR